MTIAAEDRETLLSLARRAVEDTVNGMYPSAPENASGILLETRGCFVTLTNAGKLRGCMGTFQPDSPLGEMIVKIGSLSARDPRFTDNPITPGELGELDLEVSVLSPLEKTDDPAGLTIGQHGIYIVSGGRSGCFLPEVATDQGWNVEEFLGFCCAHKAGLPADAWRNPSTEVFLFTSEKF